MGRDAGIASQCDDTEQPQQKSGENIPSDTATCGSQTREMQPLAITNY